MLMDRVLDFFKAKSMHDLHDVLKYTFDDIRCDPHQRIFFAELIARLDSRLDNIPITQADYVLLKAIVDTFKPESR